MADKITMGKGNFENVADDFMNEKKDNRLFRANLKIYELKWYPNGINCVSSGRLTVKPAHVPPLMVRKAQWRR